MARHTGPWTRVRVRPRKGARALRRSRVQRPPYATGGTPAPSRVQAASRAQAPLGLQAHGISAARRPQHERKCRPKTESGRVATTTLLRRSSAIALTAARTFRAHSNHSARIMAADRYLQTEMECAFRSDRKTKGARPNNAQTVPRHFVNYLLYVACFLHVRRSA
eukprot:6210087-Pleurochrysis_carterae.AAC.5